MSGIPMMDLSRSEIEACHRRAVDNDRMAKLKMTENFNRANKTK